MRRRVKEFISPRAARLATGLVPQIRLGPMTMEMLDGVILLTSSCAETCGNERKEGLEKNDTRGHVYIPWRETGRDI